MHKWEDSEEMKPNFCKMIFQKRYRYSIINKSNTLTKQFLLGGLYEQIRRHTDREEFGSSIRRRISGEK
jgi:hypothetical protein